MRRSFLAIPLGLLIAALLAVPAVQGQDDAPYLERDQCRILAGPSPDDLNLADADVPVENGLTVEILCTYAVRRGATDTSLRVSSQLDHWQGRVVLYENRSHLERDARDFAVAAPNAWAVEPYHAPLENDGILKARITGQTPAAIRETYVNDGRGADVVHQVQRNSEFTALAIHLEDSSVRQPQAAQVRLHSATARWIEVQNFIYRRQAADDPERPSPALPLAEELLQAGYPNIAWQILNTDRLSHPDTGGSSHSGRVWIYAGAGLGALVLASIVALVIVPVIRQRKRDSEYLTA